jgi:hypothetical protein
MLVVLTAAGAIAEVVVLPVQVGVVEGVWAAGKLKSPPEGEEALAILSSFLALEKSPIVLR